MLRRWMYAVLVAGLGISLALVAVKPAAASTTGCTKGAYAGYCGTQVDQENPAMAWDVFRHAARVGQPLIAFPNSDTDQAVDWVALHPGTSSVDAAKMFIYAPGGRISNLCASEPSQHAPLVLRSCNGSAWQVFTAEEVGDTGLYEWVNAATGDVVSADGIRSHLTGIKPPSTPGPGVEWTLAT